MKKRLFDSSLSILSKVSNKKVVYVPTKYSDSNIMTTAAKSKFGFWYCGNVFDQSDIAYGIMANGTVEEYDTDLVVSILKELSPTFTFYDVGSNTGWYTMVATSIGQESKVYSFEPLKEHVKCQKESVLLNRKETRVEIFELALSDHEGEETIQLAGSGTSLEKGFLETDFGKREILVTTLDTLVEEKKCTPPDFIKIDVEGYEYKVLLGAKKTITSSYPILFIEIAKTMNSRHFIHKEYDAIFNLLTSLGYVPYIAMNKKLAKFNPKTTIDGVHMFLFLHKEKHMKNDSLTSRININ